MLRDLSNGSHRRSRSIRDCALLTPVLLFLLAGAAHATELTVNNTTDPASGTASNCAPANANTCSLRDAVAAAGDGDLIGFAVGNNQTITLTSNAPLAVGLNVTIDGGNSPGLTVDGNNATTVFSITGGTVSISNLSIAHGQASVTDPYQAAGQYDGGAIFNASVLTLDQVTIHDNSANARGGGIYNFTGLVTMTNSTVSGNSAPDGGGIFNADLVGTTNVAIVNSTITGNSATYGGGIEQNCACSHVTMTNATLAGNSASYGNGVAFGVAAIANSMVEDCGGVGVIDNGGNLDSGTSCLGSTPANASSKSSAVLALGPLQDNGGPTQTMLPGAGSAAINSIVCANAPLVDQRNYLRPDPPSVGLATPCDVGAVEVGSMPDPIFANGFGPPPMYQ